jgi:hypothetical protein
MKYVIHINTHDPIEIAGILAKLAAEVIRTGAGNRTLLDRNGQPIGFTELHKKQ